MFQKINNSWELVKTSARVLGKDKELIIFPIISGIALFLVSLTFMIPMFMTGFLESLSESFEIIGIVVLFLFYVVQYTVMFFFNTALVGAAMIRLNGGDPTVGDGFRIAFSRFSTIIGYALIAATVGVLLKTISEKSKGLGRAIISMIGLAWNIATFLVVPVLAVEKVGPFDAVKRSVALLKKTWGEQIVGNLGLGAFFGLVTFLVILVFVGAAVGLTIWLESALPAIIIGVALVLILVGINLVQSTLNGVYTAAVYQYATGAQRTSEFAPELVEGAFRTQ